MTGKHTATVTALLILGFTALAQAQQPTTSDTTRPDRDRAQDRDERALATDTVKLSRDIARLDTTRATLHRDQAQTKAEGQQIDSLKTVLQHDRQATPRDTAAIARDEAALKRMRAKLDQDLDRARREEAREDLARKAVDRESHAAKEAHQDIREDKPKPQEHSGAAKKQ
jgi:hypothetical protein